MKRSKSARERDPVPKQLVIDESSKEIGCATCVLLKDMFFNITDK